MIIGSVLVAIVLWSDPANPFAQWVAAAMLWFGGIGFYDDYLKSRHQDSRMGMSQGTKLLLQSCFAVVFMLFYLSSARPALWMARGSSCCRVSKALRRRITSSGSSCLFSKNRFLYLGWLYIPFGVFVILAISNSVNFADGLDGLAIVPASLTAAVYAIFAYIIGNSIIFPRLAFYPYCRQQ